jgi:osmotically-inducible protein OsmY/sporulation protein YlmC with PRC-barrel domain
MTILRVYSASSIIGEPLRDATGNDLGRVEDVVLDAGTGSAAYAVVRFHFAGEKKLFAIPWRALDSTPGDGALILDVPRTKLERAPSFDLRAWPDMNDPDWASGIHSYYGYDPYWRERQGPVFATSYDDGRAGRGWLAAALVALLLLGGVTVLFLAWQDPSTAATLEEAATTVKRTSEDLATTAGVKTALALSRNVSAFDIDVDTVSGVVTLSGAVPSERIKAFALAIAEDTAGVNAVRDALVVNPTVEPIPESERLTGRVGELEIAVMVGESFEGDHQLDSERIDIHVEGGVVTLSGQVADDSQKARAGELARGVEGVTEVINSILVAP